jgi:hypothetical protein
LMAHLALSWVPWSATRSRRRGYFCCTKNKHLRHGPLQAFPCSSAEEEEEEGSWRKRPHQPPTDPLLLLPLSSCPNQGASATLSARTTRSGRPKRRSSSAAGPARRCSTQACRGGRSLASTLGPGPGTASYPTTLTMVLFFFLCFLR